MLTEAPGRLYGREVMEILPLEVVMLTDFMPDVALRCLQIVEGIRPDVLVVGLSVRKQ